MSRQLQANIAQMPAELAARISTAVVHPELQVEAARSGDITARLDTGLIHSAYDPRHDAKRWADALTEGPVIINGLGLGYEAEAALAVGKQVHVNDEGPGLLKALLANRDLSGILGRVTFESAHKGKSCRLASHSAAVFTNQGIARVDRGVADLAAFTARIAAGKHYRLLVVGPAGGGSLPAFTATVAALTAMGHEVRALDFSFLEATLAAGEKLSSPDNRTAWENGCVSLASQMTPLVCEEWRPDAVLALAQAPLLPAALASIENAGIPTALWFVEDWNTIGWWRQVAGSYTLIAHIQRDTFPAQAKGYGLRNELFLPTAADYAVAAEAVIRNKSASRSKLTFCGAAYPNRLSFLRGIADMGLEIYGDRYDVAGLDRLVQRSGARLTHAELFDVYASSDININLHSSQFCDGIDLAGDFINPRTFELGALAAFQLTDRRSTLTDFFNGDEMVTFASISELRDQIASFSTKAEERCKIASRTQQRVLTEHTYTGRMRQLLAELERCDGRLEHNRLDRLERSQKNSRIAATDSGLSQLLAGGADFETCLASARAKTGVLSRTDLLMRALGCITPSRVKS